MIKNKKDNIKSLQNRLTNRLNLYLSENIEVLGRLPKKPYIVATDIGNPELLKISTGITLKAVKRGKKNVLLAFPLDGNWGFSHFLTI